MKAALRFMVASALAVVTGSGCAGKTDAEDSETAAETGIPPTTTITTTRGTGATDPGPATSAQDTDEGDSADSSDSATSTAAGDSTTSAPNPTGGGGTPIDCGGTTYACGDGEDNDGDGRIDLFDPECTGPCDDDESSYQTGIPGDNMDCKQDCFFDGNSGQGDDGCNWNLRCDPANPGEFINCEYNGGGGNCDNQPPNQDEDCLEFCEAFVPPGCDCFGCCEVPIDEGSIWIFLNSHPDCALDNLDACTQCTPQVDDCGVECVPGDCQLCFGQTELPDGCEEADCPAGEGTCASNDDFYCFLDCCYPPPPG